MTDLNTQTKAQVAALIGGMTASQIKKTSKADLVAMVEAQPPKLTAMEKRVLVAYLEAGIDANGAETLDDMLADNMTWGDLTAPPQTRTKARHSAGLLIPERSCR